MKIISFIIFLTMTSITFADMNADELYNEGMELVRKRNSNMFNRKTKADPPKVPGGLIIRHPLLNHARRLFKDATKNPNAEQVRAGELWSCLKFSGLDFGSELIPSTLTRAISFNSFGSGILEEVSYGTNVIKMYALDKIDLAGINESGDLYEAIRLTENGDLILESSVQGVTWWFSFFSSIMSAGKDVQRLLKVVQKAMIASISQADNSGLVFDYTICPGSRVIPQAK